MPKGVHSSRSSSHSRSGVSFCWGSDCGWFWSSGCQVTSPCKGVVAGWSVAIGWVLWVGSSAVVATYINCQPSEHRRNMASGRGVGWYLRFMCQRMHAHWLIAAVFLVDHFERDVPPHPFSRVCLGEGVWALQHWIRRARIRNLGGVADMGKVHISTSLCGGVEPIQRQYYSGGYHLGEISWCCWSRCICCVSAWGSSCAGRSFCKLSEKWVPCEARRIPRIWSPPLKRCRHRTAASVFGSLDPFSMTEFVVNRLKGSETKYWMASRPALRKAIIMSGLSMPGLVDVVANIVGLWPLVVLYLKKTGRKDDGDGLVVRSSTVGVLFASCKWAHHFFVVIKEADGRVSVPRSACSHEVPAVIFF